MDRVTESLLNNFVTKYDLHSLSPSDQFEYFANYCTFSTQIDDNLPLEDCHTGGSNDTGLDGIAIIVNGVICTDAEDLDPLIESKTPLSVKFLFCQAKRGSSFSGEEIGTFLYGIKDLFSKTSTLVRNNAIISIADIVNALYDHSSLFRPVNPSVDIYYVTTGTWLEDQNLRNRVDTDIASLTELNMFSEINFYPIGATELQNLHRENESGVTSEIVFSNNVALPDMPGVNQAYLGTIPATEFLKLIQNNKGVMRKNIFYENIRDYQDMNKVNTKITETLQHETERKRFAIYNNGVTVVAKELRTVGSKFHLENYQIINGCQTSHVIHNNSLNLTDETQIPLRIIELDDDDVRDSTIIATNSQTAVKDTQLLALNNFHKKLETYFSTFEGDKHLYYERRLKQYSTSPGVEKIRIVPILSLMRSFSAIVLSEPHFSFYTKRLEPIIGTHLFNETDQLAPYHACAYSQFKLEQLIRARIISPNLRTARYHLLLVARYLVMGPDIPRLNSRESERKFAEYSLQLENHSEEIFRVASDKLIEIFGDIEVTRPMAKKIDFTKQLVRGLR